MEMMESLINKADYFIEQSHEVLMQGGSEVLQGQALFRKLATVYAEEAAKTPRVKSISLTHKLLEKLVKRESLNCLVVNLYRGNEGYSLAIKMSSGLETETVRLSYEEDVFLTYIDNEKLPPMLLDLLDESNIEIYHSGCVIAEIRDYRRTLDSSYDTRYILLRPTSQSIAADVASLTREREWSNEEKLQLEAEIVNRTAPPLNLSPSPMVAIINNKLHQRKYKFSTVPIKRAARRFSQIAQNRQKVFEESAAPKCLKLHNFLHNKKDRRLAAKNITKPVNSGGLDDGPDLQAPEIIEVPKFARTFERPNYTTDNSLVFIEELVLETERGQGRIYHTKLTISQRKTDEVYFGELYVDRDYQEGKQNGSTCKFQLGTQQQVCRYIQQFKEIFTEDWRKSVKITHRVAGQAAYSTFMQGSRDKKDVEVLKQSSQQNAQQQTGTAQQTQTPTQQAGQQTVAVAAGGGTVVAPATTVTQHTPQNVIIVSNGEGGVKKSVTVVTKPIAVTSAPALTSLISAQPTQQTSGHQVVVARSANLTNLLAGRGAVSGAGMAGVAGGLTGATKLAVAVTTGVGGTKISLPSLTTQLSRTVPAYSQAVSLSKSQTSSPSLTALLKGTVPASTQAVSAPRPQVVSLVGGVADTSGHKPTSSEPSSSLNVSGLQQLLAGTPSADNPAPQRNGPSLLDRLSAQSSSSVATAAAAANKEGVVKVGGGGTSGGTVGGSAAAAVLRSDSGSGGPPPNVNIASLNLPGLNVAGLQSLTTNLSGLQNVQVTIPGLAVPISLSLNVPVSSSTGVILSSPPPASVATKVSGSTAVTSAATVMIASQPAIQQGQVVQLPIGQLNPSQLAAQLTKSSGQQGGSSSSIPVLQVQGVGGQLFTSVRGGTASGSSGGSGGGGGGTGGGAAAAAAAVAAAAAAAASGSASTTAALPQQTVQVALQTGQSAGTVVSGGDGTLAIIAKQKLQLQQKLAAIAKRSQQQQQQAPQQQSQGQQTQQTQQNPQQQS